MRDQNGRLFTLELIKNGEFYEVYRKYLESDSWELLVTTVSYYLALEVEYQVLIGKL